MAVQVHAEALSVAKDPVNSITVSLNGRPTDAMSALVAAAPKPPTFALWWVVPPTAPLRSFWCSSRFLGSAESRFRGDVGTGLWR